MTTSSATIGGISKNQIDDVSLMASGALIRRNCARPSKDRLAVRSEVMKLYAFKEKVCRKWHRIFGRQGKVCTVCDSVDEKG